MQSLVSKVSEYTPDNLIPDSSFPLQVGSVKLASGQGVLLRGSVVGKNVSGTFVLADKTNSIEADAILTDSVDTGDTAGTEIIATAYISGTFNRDALTVGGTDTVSDHEDTLRTKGIYLKFMI